MHPSKPLELQRRHQKTIAHESRKSFKVEGRRGQVPRDEIARRPRGLAVGSGEFVGVDGDEGVLGAVGVGGGGFGGGALRGAFLNGGYDLGGCVCDAAEDLVELVGVRLEVRRDQRAYGVGDHCGQY